MSGEFWLNDRQWARLAPLLPSKPRGVPRVETGGRSAALSMCCVLAAAGL